MEKEKIKEEVEEKLCNYWSNKIIDYIEEGNDFDQFSGNGLRLESRLHRITIQAAETIADEIVNRKSDIDQLLERFKNGEEIDF